MCVTRIYLSYLKICKSRTTDNQFKLRINFVSTDDSRICSKQKLSTKQEEGGGSNKIRFKWKFRELSLKMDKNGFAEDKLIPNLKRIVLYAVAKQLWGQSNNNF